MVISDSLLQKLFLLNNEVQKSLKKKGFNSAKKLEDGSIQVGKFTIKKCNNGFFSVLDQNHYIILDKINLPHTAAILANKLACGKWTDREILDLDRKYGHYSFVEELYTEQMKKSKKDYDKLDILSEKQKIARIKKAMYKKQIQIGFDKLFKIA